MVRVFLVLPDLSFAKAVALSEVGGVDVLVSYSILVMKPGMRDRLEAVRDRLGVVMLDSGAYHHARGVVDVDPVEYASFAWENRRLWHLVVAPDVPGNPGETLRRTLIFDKHYPGEGYIPVIQGGRVEDYLGMLRELEAQGLASEGFLVGVGGLDGEKRRIAFLSKLLSKLPDKYRYHLFGVGARILRGLARRGLLYKVYSVDSSAWLMEIRYRRRTVYKASDLITAEILGIKGYLERVEYAIQLS